MRIRLYFSFALRIQLPSANEKIRIFRCVQSHWSGYKLSRVALGTRMDQYQYLFNILLAYLLAFSYGKSPQTAPIAVESPT